MGTQTTSRQVVALCDECHGFWSRTLGCECGGTKSNRIRMIAVYDGDSLIEQYDEIRSSSEWVRA